MMFNQNKMYPELLDIISYSPNARMEVLRKIYERDIQENDKFKFRGVQIFPVKSDGKDEMDRSFRHLTTREFEKYDEEGKYIGKGREFDMDRSRRLHWVLFHVLESKPDVIDIFTIVKRDQKKRRDVKRIYIFDEYQKYVIIMERQGSNRLFLLTAYYLNEEYGFNEMKNLQNSKNRQESIL